MQEIQVRETSSSLGLAELFAETERNRPVPTSAEYVPLVSLTILIDPYEVRLSPRNI
jgi:hypothetical protein